MGGCIKIDFKASDCDAVHWIHVDTETSDSVQGRSFLAQMSDRQLPNSHKYCIIFNCLYISGNHIYIPPAFTFVTLHVARRV
jgi:hypothetical protein